MNAKIVLAAGIAALLVSVLLIAGFLIYLYQRPMQGPAADRKAPETGKPQIGVTPRPKGPVRVEAADIAKITFFESNMVNRSSSSPAGFLSNVNVDNFSSSSSSVTFNADGTAVKQTTSETTVNGKRSERRESFTGSPGPDAFAGLARVMADNDFANEPDSRDITSLPIKKILTIAYNGGEKVINTGHIGKDSPETTAMLTAIKELERTIAWRPAN